MPTRIIREGIISSEAVNILSPAAEIFYRRLMSVADDYGRFHAHPSLLRGACYALQLDRITDKDVSKSLAECVAAKLIFLYSGGKCLQLVKFNQQCRSKSKFPEPTDNELLINCEANVKQLHTDIDKGRAAPTTTPTPTPTTTGGGNGGRFQVPTIEEIKLLAAKIGLPESEASKFFNYYQANGWRVGKNPMKSVAGAVAYWKSNWEEKRGGSAAKPDYSKGF